MEVAMKLKAPVVLLIVFSTLACTPILFSVNLEYQARRLYPQFKISQPIIVTVSTFEDNRHLDDKTVIGWVTTQKGQRIPIIPKFINPNQAVVEPIKVFIQRLGFTVLSPSPSWNLKESDIDKKWGRLLIGGSIEALEIQVEEAFPLHKYHTRVKLALTFADPSTQKIIYTFNTESMNSLSYPLLSEQKMEELINSALTEALDRIFENSKVKEILEHTAIGNS